jgi:hypothetical protein
MTPTIQHDILYVNMLETCGRECLFINYDHLTYTKLDVNEQHCYGVRTQLVEQIAITTDDRLITRRRQ